MPLLQVKTNQKLEKAQADYLISRMVKVISNEINKPLSKIMGFIEESQGIMNQSSDPMMLINIHSKGEMDTEKKRQVCEALYKTISEEITISEERIYILFSSIADGCAWQFNQGGANCGLNKK